MDSTVLRIGIAIAGVLLIAAIYFFGRPRKPGQGRRVGARFRRRRGAPRPNASNPRSASRSADELRASGEQSQSELDARRAQRTTSARAATPRSTRS